MKSLIEIKNLKKHFPIYGGILKKQVGAVHAVDGISFDIYTGETLGLVGESGCGKTTAGRTILRLIEPTTGEAYFEGNNIFQMKAKEIREIRREMQLIFQDPFSSLNPAMTVYSIIREPLEIQGLTKGIDVEGRVLEIIEKLELEPHHIYRYPHEFSGGQRQRIAIARALVVNPKFVIADEPVASIDVSMRAVILNLMRNLQKSLKLTYLFISHDLSVIKYMCNRVAVMYLGKIVELAATKELFKNPEHPYTQALISAIPIPDPTVRRKRIILKGDVPSPINPPKGCRFHPRCPYTKEICKREEPSLIELKKGYQVACHLRF